MTSGNKFTGEKYNLRWNSHKNSLVNYLGNHLVHEDFVDVTLACEGKYLKAHKLILSACSSYFKELFQVHEVDKPLIILNNVTFKQLKLVIDFIYTGEIKVLDSELDNILTLGNNLKIKGLSNIQDNGLGNQNNSSIPSKNSNETSRNHENTKAAPGKLTRKGKSILKPIKLSNLQAPSSHERSVLRHTVVEKPETKDQNQIEDRPKRRKIMVKQKSQELQNSELNKINSLMGKTETSTFTTTDSASSTQEGAKKLVILENVENLPQKPVEKPPPVYPVSAFMIFANEWRKKLSVEHPKETTKQISLRLSSMWKNLSEETKESFYETARLSNNENKT